MDLGRTFDIGVMPAVAQHDEAGSRNRLSDVSRTGERDEVIVATNDERRDAQTGEVGQQIVSGRFVRLVPESFSDGFCFEDTVLRPAHLQVFDQPIQQLWGS